MTALRGVALSYERSIPVPARAFLEDRVAVPFLFRDRSQTLRHHGYGLNIRAAGWRVRRVHTCKATSVRVGDESN